MISEISKSSGIDVDKLEIIDVPDSNAAALKAVELVRRRSSRDINEGEPAHR